MLSPTSSRGLGVGLLPDASGLFRLGSAVFLNGGFCACDCGPSEVDFLLSHDPKLATDLQMLATLGKFRYRGSLLNSSKTGHMRRRGGTPTTENIRTRGEGWLDVERAAVVEVTSEDADCPVESAFSSGDARGWRAAAPANDSARLRSAAKAEVHIACVRGK
jgi:hypothetical protein